MNSQTSKLEPDPDSIKMFVGQIPRSMDERELRLLFEEFGQVYQLNVLRDKATNQSKGCCFVTFYTKKAALDAQSALHNVKTMAGMQHPVQMKPADSEKRNDSVEERKLFVGMLAKRCSETEVKSMFTPYGQIEDCTVLRDQSGQSKGCAFVTFSSRSSAQNAVKGAHHSQTMEGCRFPLVVKFADTQKEKEMKKFSQVQSSFMNNMAGLSGMGSMNPQYMSQSPGGSGFGGIGNMGNLGNLGGINALQLQQILSAASLLQNNPGDMNQSLQNLQSLAALASLTGAGSSMLGKLSSYGMGGLANTSQSSSSMGSMHGGSGMGASSSNSMNGLASSQSSMDALSQAYSGIQQYAASFPNAFAPQSSQLHSSSNSAAGKQTEVAVSGPDGANLFIYHLPQEFGDHDLMQMFAPFGSVISAKVFIDKQTNLSKCFGFVSFDNPLSAQAAIQAMNGFQIGMKRLKVQLKRPKSENKPY